MDLKALGESLLKQQAEVASLEGKLRSLHNTIDDQCKEAMELEADMVLRQCITS